MEKYVLINKVSNRLNYLLNMLYFVFIIMVIPEIWWLSAIALILTMFNLWFAENESKKLMKVLTGETE